MVPPALPELNELVRRLSESPLVAAITVVGSAGQSDAPPDSDIDVFVYADGELNQLRKSVAAELAEPSKWMAVGDRAFGDGDVWQARSKNVWIDLVYWSRTWAEDELQRLLHEHLPRMGYTTAFWRSIRDGRPLYERDDWHQQLQQHAREPYPAELRSNIISCNFPYLRDHQFSFRNQLEKAIRRGDVVSMNHRVTAWLGSYFDIVFALNDVLHPGEKRILDFVERECAVVPPGLFEGIGHLLDHGLVGTERTLQVMDAMTEELRALLEAGP